MNRTVLPNISRTPSTALAKAILAGVVLLFLSTSSTLQAQTFHVLYTFTNGTDGADPYPAPTLDRAGNLYGTTSGWSNNGGVYELQRHGSSWIFKSLYNFQSQNDGAYPEAPVVFGPDGTLYGTTHAGGNECFSSPCGTVFNLQPPARICSNVNCPWTERPVYWFGGNQLHDGYHPSAGPLIFDSAGNIYGSTTSGGTTGNGTVYQLVGGQNGWTENILDNFLGGNSPAQPLAGVTFDAAGNLYGTSQGYTYGAVYALIRSGQDWNQQTIHVFQGGNDGSHPNGGLIFDAAGNAYGTTEGGRGQPGTVFELTPQSDGTWTETVLHLFSSGSIGPRGNLAMDEEGNLYGATEGLGGGDQFGMVFKLSYMNGSWTFTALYHFTAGDDGQYPVGGVSIDSSGNLYGTSSGGANNFGTVWEITP